MLYNFYEEIIQNTCHRQQLQLRFVRIPLQSCGQHGRKNIVLGNLFIPGCTVDIHSANALYGAPVYQYFKNTDGQWKSTMFATIEKAIKEEDWDVITMQQGSGSSGMPDAFSNLGLLVDCVNKIKPEKQSLCGI